jgi:hypothetical protein
MRRQSHRRDPRRPAFGSRKVRRLQPQHRQPAAPEHLDGQTWDARPLGESSFLVEPSDPDDPAVTFGGTAGRPQPRAIHVGLWAVPRRRGTLIL